MIYRSKHYETQSKDYEFSRRSMTEHWDSGIDDMTRTLTDPAWSNLAADAQGLHVFDVPAADGSRTEEPRT